MAKQSNRKVKKLGHYIKMNGAVCPLCQVYFRSIAAHGSKIHELNHFRFPMVDRYCRVCGRQLNARQKDACCALHSSHGYQENLDEQIIKILKKGPKSRDQIIAKLNKAPRSTVYNHIERFIEKKQIKKIKVSKKGISRGGPVILFALT